MLYIIIAAIILAATAVCMFSPLRKIVVPAGGAAFLLWTLACSVTVVSNEDVGVEKRFGRTVESAYGPGIHFVAPWATVHRYYALRREFPIEGDVITFDNNPLTVNVGFATKLNSGIAWKILKTVGPDYFTGLVEKAAQTAVRDGIAMFPWTKAVTSDRGEVQLAIQSNFERILVEQFVANGLAEVDAKAALSVSPVQLRSARPDAKVLNAVAERSAADQDLQRQKTLTDIAAEEALRRTNEGDGVANLFGQLPKGFTSSEIAEVLSALATKTRADAMLKAVEGGQVTGIIMNGDTAGNVAASFPLSGREAKSATAD